MACNHDAPRARRNRIEAGDSIVDVAVALDVPAVAVLAMERGDPDAAPLSLRVIGHYRGLANAKPIECPIGQRLRELRMAAGDTQEALARKLKVPAPYISKVERDPMRWSRSMARRMAAEYGQKIARLEPNYAYLD